LKERTIVIYHIPSSHNKFFKISFVIIYFVKPQQSIGLHDSLKGSFVTDIYNKLVSYGLHDSLKVSCLMPKSFQ